MVTVRVTDECVVIHLKKKSKREKILSSKRYQSEWLQPDVAAAITKWASSDFKADVPSKQNSSPAPSDVPVISAIGNQLLQPFRAAKPEMVIYEDRITLCGADIWRECTQTYTRDAFALLSRKDKNGFVRIKGTRLTKDLGCPASNQIGAHFSRFCHRAIEVMRDKGLDCCRDDIIQNFAGGYHFREWMRVRVVGTWAAALGIVPSDEIDPEGSDAAIEDNARAAINLNERQQWIIDQVDRGVRLTMKDIAAHFRNVCDRSTIGRDLKDLRQRVVLTTNAQGYYVRNTLV